MNVIYLLLLVACSLCSCSPVFDAHVALNSSAAATSADSALNATTSSSKMRKITTSIAGAMTFWTAATYFFVIYHGSSLAQGLALPRRSLQRGLAVLVAQSWAPYFVSPLDRNDKTRIKVVRLQEAPQAAGAEQNAAAPVAAEDAEQPEESEESEDSEESEESGDSEATVDVPSDETRSVSERTTDKNEKFSLGHQELQESASAAKEESDYDDTKKSGQVLLHPETPAMKNIIIAAIWQCWSIWMAVAMVFLTAIYNGFFFGPQGPDAVLRLTLICIYAGINLAHAVTFCLYFWQILDAVANQACWVAISKAFYFLPSSEHHARLYKLKTKQNNKGYNFYWSKKKPLYLRKFECQLLGSITTLELYRSCNYQCRDGDNATFNPDGGPNQGDPMNFEPIYGNPSVFHKHNFKIKKKAEVDLKSMIDVEVKALEKAAELGLEKLLANVIVILGICLSTGLAPLTTIRSIESVAAQIGSYAIILSVSTGVISLIANLTHMSNAVHSATALRRFQHYILGLSKKQYEKGVLAGQARYGVPGSPDPEIPSIVRLADLASSTTSVARGFLWVVWGPALGLLPSTSGDVWIISLLKLPFRFLRQRRPRMERQRNGRGDEEEELLLSDCTADQGIVRFEIGYPVSQAKGPPHAADAAPTDAIPTLGSGAPTAIDAPPGSNVCTVIADALTVHGAPTTGISPPAVSPGAPTADPATDTIFQLDLAKGDLCKINRKKLKENRQPQEEESVIPLIPIDGSGAEGVECIPLMPRLPQLAPVTAVSGMTSTST